MGEKERGKRRKGEGGGRGREEERGRGEGERGTIFINFQNGILLAMTEILHFAVKQSSVISSVQRTFLASQVCVCVCVCSLSWLTGLMAESGLICSV